MIINSYRFASGGGGGGGAGVFRGANYAIDQSGTSASLAVPAGAVTGDQMVAVLLCRGDRTFSTPAGWTVVAQSIGGSTGTATRYVMQKAWASETNVAFTQSAAAAYGYALILTSKPLGANQLVAGSPATITKSSASSDLINAITAVTETALPAPPVGYTLHGRTYFTSGASFFYAATISTQSMAASGTQSASVGSGGATDRYMFLAEVGS